MKNGVKGESWSRKKINHILIYILYIIIYILIYIIYILIKNMKYTSTNFSYFNVMVCQNVNKIIVM